MKVGVSIFVQNFGDWDRFEAAERGEPVASRPAYADQKRFHNDLTLAKAVEPLGFDSIWTVEHHFTPYTMVTNPLQYLSYMAGCTERVDLGTMVIVLPWHHPVRVAEDIAMLDSFLGPERELKIGFGRGLGKREFDGFNVDMSVTRETFNENLQIILGLLGNDSFSYEGERYSFKDLAIRPTPPKKRDVNSFSGAWGSTGSVGHIAKTGLKPLIIPVRAWDDYIGELAEFERVRKEHGFMQEAAPKLALWIYCAETEEEAEKGARQYLGEYGVSALRHYQTLDGHFKTLRGYESYAEGADMMKDIPKDDLIRANGELMVANHIFGTPRTCVAKLKRLADIFDPSEIMLIFSFGLMEHETAMKSMNLFAREALKECQSWQTGKGKLI